MTGDTYREINDLDQARAYIGALERENAQLQWKLIQMGQLCQKLGGRPMDAYRRQVPWSKVVLRALTVVLCGAVGTLLFFIAITATNVTGCAQ